MARRSSVFVAWTIAIATAWLAASCAPAPRVPAAPVAQPLTSSPTPLDFSAGEALELRSGQSKSVKAGDTLQDCKEEKDHKPQARVTLSPFVLPLPRGSGVVVSIYVYGTEPPLSQIHVLSRDASYGFGVVMRADGSRVAYLIHLKYLQEPDATGNNYVATFDVLLVDLDPPACKEPAEKRKLIPWPTPEPSAITGGGLVTGVVTTTVSGVSTVTSFIVPRCQTDVLTQTHDVSSTVIVCRPTVFAFGSTETLAPGFIILRQVSDDKLTGQIVGSMQSEAATSGTISFLPYLGFDTTGRLQPLLANDVQSLVKGLLNMQAPHYGINKSFLVGIDASADLLSELVSTYDEAPGVRGFMLIRTTPTMSFTNQSASWLGNRSFSLQPKPPAWPAMSNLYTTTNKKPFIVVQAPKPGSAEFKALLQFVSAASVAY